MASGCVRPTALLLPLLLTTGCSMVSDDLSKQLLQPQQTWLAEPADFGLQAERFEIVLHSEASITGFVIPNAAANGRTVVLFHDADTNLSAVHPYWRFLHEAGLQVVVFDPRGYGKSVGTATLQAWIYDLPKLFRWLRERPDIDQQRVALFGTGMGAVAAMWAARTQGCQALVIEHLPSPRDMLRESKGGDGSALGAYELGFLEYAGLPEEIEPDDNAPGVKVPALFLGGDSEPARDRKSLARTFGNYGGSKQLWIMAGTGKAPHGMLTHDGEYQWRIGAFLNAALGPSPMVLRTDVRKVDDARDGQAFYELEIAPTSPIGARAALEACAVLADGTPHYTRTWIDGARSRVRLKLPSTPVAAGAVHLQHAVEDAEAVFRREPSALTRSGAAVDALWSRIESLRNDTLTPGEQQQLAADLAAAETEPFHPRLAAELCDVWARLGATLHKSPDQAQREAGSRLLQRAVASAPEKPHLHVWPGPTATYGWPQEEDVATARRLLAAAAK